MNYFYHYFERSSIPFRSLSFLQPEEAAKRIFRAKGGETNLIAPLYMSVGESDFISSWFVDPVCIKIPAKAFKVENLSFCYGDIRYIEVHVWDDEVTARYREEYEESLKLVAER